MAEKSSHTPGTSAASLFTGLRVLDASTLLAAPLAASILGDFGAEVIKIEDPRRGDPLRTYLPQRDGVSLIHKVTNRNKHQVSLDLRNAEGRELFRRLVVECDVVVLNFRLPTLQGWQLDYSDLAPLNPRLIMLHLTAYGRTGPYRERPGFARVSEAFSGIMGITGFPDRQPVPAGYPVVDGLTGLVGALALCMALYDRERTGLGQLVDLALYDGMFRILEDVVIGYDQTGESRERLGTANPYVAPNDIYRCADGEWLVLPVSTEVMFERLGVAMGTPELARDARFSSNVERVHHRVELDALINRWLSGLTAAEAARILQEHNVPCGPVYSAAEILEDPHMRARGSIASVFDDELKTSLRMQAPMPLLSRTPGAIRFPGRPKGADTFEILQRILNISADTCRELAQNGIIQNADGGAPSEAGEHVS